VLKQDKIVLGDLHGAQAGIGQHGVVGINNPIVTETDSAQTSLEKAHLRVIYVTLVP